ncbi:GPI-anchor transamidase subunit S [Marchantia polymorpha subsp. ruderalis]|uniref:GPI transamidase component PIG-S n=2 Tax=Marchantia polymorpha TaxID=3197 RepID=A0AAF6BTV3_MARPO|nr:hypothetical protein MARPO_0045s0104 [Marchantia polymorpha]BBN15437.1 hypothetical protein Mp_6g19590 [Marchantia polymorpha subsp. ruderalis]|eukprot:PTQ39450.1 hypothetical protein MARPO_0045s0104 [Marchantia polymorpha]
MADTRTTKPGIKRLLITITTLLPFFFGIPLWLNSTQVYRAPLPFKDVDALGSWASENTLLLPCRLNVIFASKDEFLTKPELDSVASQLILHVQSLMGGNSSDHETCQNGFNIQVKYDTENVCLTSGQTLDSPTWPCGLVKYGFFNSAQLSDDILDNVLWNYANKEENESTVQDEGGLYTVVVLRKSQIESLDSFSKDDVSTGGCTNEQSSICKSKTGWSTVVGKYRHAWIIGDFNSSTVESEVVPRIGDVALTFLRGSRSASGRSKARNLPLSAEGEAILSFSLLNADPDTWIFDWDFEELKRQFFQPVVEALSGIARLTIESQVLYYTPKAVQSRWDASLNAHVVAVKQLPFFVNSNEWHLDTSSAAAGRSKLLHFAIYVPGGGEYPLHFLRKNDQLSSTDGFTSPGWGGVVVYNPTNLSTISSDSHSSFHRITPKEFESIAGVIVAQLRTLFGLPPILSDDPETGYFSLSPARTGFAEWELDLLLRRRAISDMTAAASTLMSLSRLVQKLSSMVIMDEIGEQVKNSLSAAAAARDHAAHGAYRSTAESASKAASLAEAAFFQPSIMSVLYNPTEHHLAIYTPFFVPVLLHAVLAVIKEASRYRGEWKKFKQKKE